MDIMAKLGRDIASLWSNYAGSYLNGIANTLLLALAATLIGCVIGFVCGVLQTIPCSKNDLPLKRGLLTAVRAIVRAYVEVFRGTPMVLQAVFINYGLPYFTNAAMKFTNVWGAALLLPYVEVAAPLLGYAGNGGNMGLWGVCDWNAYGTFYYFSGFVGYLVLAYYLVRYPLRWSWRRTRL